MANLGRKGGVYVARFRYNGKEYKRSLKPTDRKSAEAAMHRVEDALHRLAVNVIGVPQGVDAGDFIISGGTLTTPTPKPIVRDVPTLDAAISEYLADLGHLAESNRATVAGHLRNLKKKLASKLMDPLDCIEQRDLEGFIQARLRERSPTTVSQERVTVGQFFTWATACGYLASSPAASLTKVKPTGDLPPFRTLAAIEALIARGGLSEREVLSLWDSLFLNPAEIADLLALVRERAAYDVSLIMHAIPAYTGMRRGEIMRLQWVDIEFEQDSIVARSKKQSRQAVETRRRIDLHPELKQILLEWRDKRPTGQYVVCEAGSHRPMSSRQTTTRFFQALRGTKWCLSSSKDWFKLGFHTYRHSFVSNLAAAGVDQRLIDAWMGHQTDSMRMLYMHLFPASRQSAIMCFSLSSPAGPCRVASEQGAVDTSYTVGSKAAESFDVQTIGETQPV